MRGRCLLAGLGQAEDLSLTDLLDLTYVFVTEAVGGPSALTKLNEMLNDGATPETEPDPASWGEDAEAQDGMAAMMALVGEPGPRGTTR